MKFLKGSSCVFFGHGACGILVPGPASNLCPLALELWSVNHCTQRRQWHPTPILLPGKSHERRSLVGSSMGLLRVGHNWVTSLSLFAFIHWRRKWQPTPVFLPGESQGWGAWWAAVYGVAQSRTRLKQLSSSSSMHIERNTFIIGFYRRDDGIWLLDHRMESCDTCACFSIGKLSFVLQHKT